MARIEYGRHKVIITGTDDAGKQVSKNAWNDDNEQLGVFGFDDPSETLLVSGVLTPTNTDGMIIVGAESGTEDTIDTLIDTNYQVNDLVGLKNTSGDSIFVSTTGNFRFDDDVTLIKLNAKNALWVRWSGTDWKEWIKNKSALFDNTSRAVLAF